MDVLLINPPREIPQRADFPPMGLAYISSHLKQNGIDAGVLDASAFSWHRLEREVKRLTPSIVGIPCWTLEREQTFKTASLAKKIYPHVKIINGGHHATAFPEHMFKLANADAVVIGEGEVTILELAKALLNGDDLRKIKGIAYQKGNEIIINERRDLIDDLDSIQFPSYDEFNLNDYLGIPESKGMAAAVITSRGCPYKCIYCSSSKFWKRRWRARSPENVLDEVEWLYRDYGVSSFMFFDDNFTVRKERAIEICRGIIERKIYIEWVSCSHVNHPDEELLGWMRKAGCYRIDYGVESGSARVLNNIKKRQSIEQIKRAFRLTSEAGIMPRAYLMVGNPGEDDETIKETVSLMKMIKPYDTSSGQMLWILPDTEIYEMARAKGIISDDFWLKSNSTVYYTAEHDIKKLKSLRSNLIRGIAKNNGDIKSYIEYLKRKVYYNYPILQKLRKWRWTKGW